MMVMFSLPDPEDTIELTPCQVAEALSQTSEHRPLLIDCRERDEFDFCRIEGCHLVPMADIPAQLEMIREAANRGVIVYCHHGMRSLHSVAYLRAHGIEASFSMAGGIDRWACEVDGEVPRY